MSGRRDEDGCNVGDGAKLGFSPSTYTTFRLVNDHHSGQRGCGAPKRRSKGCEEIVGGRRVYNRGLVASNGVQRAMLCLRLSIVVHHTHLILISTIDCVKLYSFFLYPSSLYAISVVI